jgi:hypothetical protein
MAIVKCPKCGGDVSDKAVKCPHCGKKLKQKTWFIFIIVVLICILACLFGYYKWTQQLKRQEAKRQAQIENLLKQSEEAYAVFDFDTVAQCYDELESLDYDISQQRKLLEYDMSVYEDVYVFYTVICDMDDKLSSGSFNSLRTLVDSLKNPIEDFKALEINPESEIGKYIKNVRTNAMFQLLDIEYVNSNEEIDLDYEITQKTYVNIIRDCLDEIKRIRFPYEAEQSTE